MTMREAFPGTSAAYPRLMDWDQPFDWTDARSRQAAVRLADMQVRFAQLSEQSFAAFCDAVADDITHATPPAAADGLPEAVDAYRQLFATMPMGMCMVRGAMGDCYGWAMWSMMRGCDRRGRVFDGLWSVVLSPAGIPSDYWRLVQRNLPRWTSTVFLLARKFGGLDVPARGIADACWNHCDRALARGGDLEECLEALMALANWASNADEPQAESWVHRLQALWTSPLPDSARAQLGILMMSPAYRFTGRDPKAWADEMLERWPHVLTEHYRVQVLASSLRSREEWAGRKAQVLEAVTALARLYADLAPNPAEALQALESRVAIIHPLIFFLTECGEIGDVLDLLGAWYVAGGRTCDNDVLFVAAGHRHGVGYLWPGGRLIIERPEDSGTFDAVLEAASIAQRDYHRSTAVGDAPPAIDLSRMGQPDEEAGPALEEATRAHYEPQRLRVALGGYRPRSMLVVPATPVPVSAMLAAEAVIAPSCEISFRAPSPDRRIRRVSLWVDSTMHAAFEAEAITRVGELAGWQVSTREGVDDPAAFADFYADCDADLLWVIGHGEHSPYRLDQSGLMIGDGLVTAGELSSPPQGHGRRLLVLNVCSGGAAQVRGGIARIGLSQELTNPDQQVIAHLWPIGMYAGLSFGAKLALELSDAPPAEALARTVVGMRAPSVLRGELVARLGEDLGIHRRLEHQDAQIGNVMAWGAPVLLT